MDDVFDSVVDENRRLRKEVKTLRERVAALESSRWWRLHPRYLLKRLRARPQGEDGTATTSAPAKVKRHAHIWALRAEYERRSAGRAADEVVIREGIRVKVHPESRASFEEFCYSSPQQIEELDAFISATSDRRTLLDVGALHGIFSLVFAANDPARRALAVDPSPAAFAKLLYNIHRNRAENVTAVECALSNKRGILEMHYEWERAVAGQSADGGTPLRVETETGDRICERYSFEPDVVKVDVDGHELRVVQGLRATLRRNRPLLFLEVHPQLIAADPGNGTLTELVEELSTLGFSRAEFHGSVVPVERIGEQDEIDRFLLRPE
jgi:FkbM family methyltransferase